MGDVEGGGSADEKPVRSVTISALQMSVAEITNEEYCSWLNGALGRGEIQVTGSSVQGAAGVYIGRQYLNLAGALDAVNRCWITFVDNTFAVVLGKEKWPVVYVTWFGAKAFAEGNGWNLPSEAEWEYACRGNRQYKYGTDDGTVSSANANYNSIIGHPVDVKSYPKNPFGICDMCGNVFEWCDDWYGAYADGSQIDPSGPQSGTFRVVRGGCYSYRNYGSRSSGRSYYYPTFAGQYVGFRVVRRISQ